MSETQGNPEQWFSAFVTEFCKYGGNAEVWWTQAQHERQARKVIARLFNEYYQRDPSAHVEMRDPVVSARTSVPVAHRRRLAQLEERRLQKTIKPRQLTLIKD